MEIVLYSRPMRVMYISNCFVPEAYGSDVMAIALNMSPMEMVI